MLRELRITTYVVDDALPTGLYMADMLGGTQGPEGVNAELLMQSLLKRHEMSEMC